MTPDIAHPSWNLSEFIGNTLNRLPSLQSLDFGTTRTIHLHHWPAERTETPLTYLRVTLASAYTLCCLMKAQPLRRTLQQLHISLSGLAINLPPQVCNQNAWPRMDVLHTFTFAKSSDWHLSEEWYLLDMLSSSHVMPVLRRMNFCIVIDINDIERMYLSSLFTDSRDVHIHYAYVIKSNREHTQLIDYIRHIINPSHRHKLVSATFLSQVWPQNDLVERYEIFCVSLSLINIRDCFKVILFSNRFACFFRKKNHQIEHIYSSPCHGSSMNLFHYVFQIDVLVISKYLDHRLRLIPIVLLV